MVKEAYQNENNLKFLQEKFSEEFSNKFVSFEMKKEEQISNSQVKLNSNTQTTQEPLIEKLVPDPIFASILNENGEIQVENTIYKVTKYGTFMVPSTKIKNLDSLIVLWNSKTTSNQTNTQSIGTQSINPIREFSPYDDAVMIENSFYSIKPDIYLYDTYGYTNGNNPDFYEADEIQSGFNSLDFLSNFVSEPVEYSSIWSTSNSLNTSPNLILITTNEDYIYNNLSTYKFGASTLAGKFLESIRGRDEIHTESFGNSNRLRVNFYDSSYIIYSALGVSVKMQKKNWIGWSGTNADEIRIGWDVLEYDASSNLSFSPPSNSWNNPSTKPSYYDVDIPGSNHKFALFDLTAFGTRVSPIIDYDANKIKQQAIKLLYDQAISLLSPWEKQNLTNKPFAYLTYAEVFNDKRIVTVGRDEERSNNNDKMTKTFDWRTGTLKLSLNSSGGISTSGEVAKNFELSRASVYGAAKYANQWKGVRIVK